MSQATCFLHPSDKALGTCANCDRPICRLCMLSVDGISYCSPDCMNALNAPSASAIPAMGRKAPAAGSVLDEVSEIVQTRGEPAAATSRAALSEPSITMRAHQADRPAVHAPTARKGSSGAQPVVIPATARGTISSSCFFHPDTSAIVRCVKCRNPICSLCAEETTEGLMCSPSCGVPDPVGERDRRSFKLLNLAVIAVLLFAAVESVLLFHSIRDARSKEEKILVDAPTFEKDLETASELLRDAEAQLRELPSPESKDPLPRGAELAAVGTKLDAALHKLGQARNLCVRWQNHPSDSQLLEQRLAAQRDLTKQAELLQERLRAPRALLQAGTLCEEAALAAATKLRDARKLCVAVEKDVPDAAAWRRQLKDIDDQLDALETRFPSLKAPR
ncbi:MAG TPA: hypothetical protein VNM14_05835 [Planctomycetota bacterium]|nr:hypothetical protein [Planctomycetota bacterium]